MTAAPEKRECAFVGPRAEREVRREIVRILPVTRLWAPLRACVRLILGFLWILLCYIGCTLGGALDRVPVLKRLDLDRRVARLWIRGMRAIIGMRLIQEGRVPKGPYFLVANHICWTDFFAFLTLCDGTCVTQTEDQTFPLLGRLIKALDPIFVERTHDDIPRVNRLIGEAIARGENVLMAPEGVISPGRVVRRFRPALLEPAAQARKPVHYASVTCRTPEGCRPASKSVLFGPDPYFRTPDGRIPESELDAWGPERSFFLHLLGLFALPWFEVTIRFGSEPILGTERHALAKGLQEGVQRIFSPVD